MKSLYSVMLANSADEKMIAMTSKAIEGYMATTEGHLTLVETNSSMKWEENKRLSVVYPNERFNYNRFLNYGFANCPIVQYDYFGVFNNDIVFEDGWLEAAFKYEWNSFSPQSEGWFKHESVGDGVYYGWETGRHFCGWAVVMDKDAFLTCYPFDERFEFWCQDDDMSMTLKAAGHKHALIGESKIRHLTSSSHYLLQEKERMTSGMVNVLNAKWQ